MKKLFTLLFISFCWQLLAQDEEDPLSIRLIFDFELTESKAYPWLQDLCLNIGHRLSGSEAASKTVDWAYKELNALGADSVWLQPVMVPHWERGKKEQAGIYFERYMMPVEITALGGSVATPEEGLKAEVVEVHNFEELKVLGEAGVKGKIVFFNRPMDPHHIITFHAYGGCVDQRWGGALEAAKYGAVGVVVRSMGLRSDNFPHTGSMGYEDGVPKIPACAISTNDADRLHEAIVSNQPLEFRFSQHCETLPDVLSYNVVAEIRGSEFPDEIILIGGHLDSWDIGHGAHDDGAGCVQSMETLRAFINMGLLPKRTIRVVLFMNEENGLRGAKEYARLTKENGWKHIAAIESDRGGFTPRGYSIQGAAQMREFIAQWREILEPYGLHYFEPGGGGADIGPLKTDDNVLIGFVPDSQRYFDVHHAATDTFDSVNKRELELGAASIIALVYLLDKYGLPAQHNTNP